MNRFGTKQGYRLDNEAREEVVRWRPEWRRGIFLGAACTAFNTDHFRAFIQLSWLGYTAVFPQNGAVGDRSGLGSTDASNSRRSLSRTTVRHPEAAEYRGPST